MKGLWQQLRVPENRRRFLLSLAVVLLLLVVARFLLGIYVQRNQELDQKISLLELQYEKSMRIIRSGKKIRARHEALKRYRRKLIADRFIWDETPSLAEARLQRLLKDMAAKSKIDVKTVKILPHVTLDGLEWLQLRVNCRAEIGPIVDFIVQVQNSPLYLFFRQLEIKSISRRDQRFFYLNFELAAATRMREL
ncbi:MAG: hypothetical protein DRH04_01330 [Deltaproteobacteria bacterium]|nr:MAG: hypothetical protein DRH04_01330 [Deltaproteobacteria bacterium]